jgi:HEAT repeat protein
MLKRLNETIDEIRLRFLGLDQLRTESQEQLEADDVDEEVLERLSSEVQRRLGATTDSAERLELQRLASHLLRRKLERDLTESGTFVDPDLMQEPFPLPEKADPDQILTWILSVSDANYWKLETIGGEAIANALDTLNEIQISQAIDALTGALSGQEHHTTTIAIGILGRIGPRANSALPMLIQLIKHGSRLSTRWAAVWAIGQMGESAIEALPVLVNIVEKEDTSRSVKCAALALGMIGPQAAAAIPALEKASADKDVGSTVELALACVKGEQPTSTLDSEIAEEDPLGQRQGKTLARPKYTVVIDDDKPGSGGMICMCSVPVATKKDRPD